MTMPTEVRASAVRPVRLVDRAFRRLSVRHKLTAISMLTSVCSLVLAGGILMAYEYRAMSRALVADLSTHAEILADNCKAAITFQDPVDANEILRSMETIPSVESVCVYTLQGERFAAYVRQGTTCPIPPPGRLKDGPDFRGPHLILTHPIVLDEERIGTICLCASLETMWNRLRSSVLVIGAILVLAALAAYLVSARLQRVISSPILHLASVANYVSDRGQYSIRAEPYGDDEIGLLIEAFNEMLEQIQRRDAALVEANEQLEARVAERMAELTAANESLTREIASRRRAEHVLVERTERIVNHQRSLLRLAKQAGIDLLPILKRTAAEVGRILDIERVGIWFLNDRTSELVCEELHTLSGTSSNGKPSLRLTNQPAYFEAIENSRILAVPDAQQDPRTRGFAAEYLEPLGITSMMAVPIRLHAKLLGLVCCEHVGTTREWSLEEQDFVASVADMIALQVQTNERRKLERALSRANEHLAETVRDLRRSNKELQEFAYVAAHDLKAPLRGIGTLTDWIAADNAEKLDADGQEQLRLLKGRVARLSELIDGILHYSEIGRVAGRVDEVDLAALVPDVIALLDAPAHVQVVVRGELPVVVGDRVRLRQVFHNLIDNAIRYMDKPEARIEISCTEEESMWQFAVSDNGPGIEEKYFEKIFQMFQTLTPRDERESTGIGLAIVRKIVELLGGTVWATSEPGEGTTFMFTLPKRRLLVDSAEDRGGTTEQG